MCGLNLQPKATKPDSSCISNFIWLCLLVKIRKNTDNSKLKGSISMESEKVPRNKSKEQNYKILSRYSFFVRNLNMHLINCATMREIFFIWVSVKKPICLVKKRLPMRVVPKLVLPQLIISGHMLLGKKCGLDKNLLCSKQEFTHSAVLQSDHKSSTQLIHVLHQDTQYKI